ncbi:hypothetical protein RSOLAG1IB_09175 [Rhizoctonia solani AG-1 IB]|uniref:Uncharacterized protein n=1 Tax=Thanatephorus cucumeris (strain AG1-IB / isolate 7/3/14) TaxID=1108050 RepID=A0A0B7FPI6_THACB|nr:hypothetical protein RSOLAG1IB_09175 [Rhizoctonia solani AG-1 IB]
MNVGGIIASIYLIPAAFILLALELGYLSSRAGALKHMQPLRIIGLQFVSAMITGVSWQSIDFFIACCVAFGMSIGLMNIVAIYYILWGRHAQEDGLYTWREGSAKSSSSEGGIIFDTKDGEDSALLIRNGSESDVESMRTSQSSLLYGGPTIVSVD